MLAIKFPGFEVLGAPYAQGVPNGFYVKKGGLKGFDDMPAGRRDAISREMQHGEFDLPVFRGPRVPSLEGIAVAASGFELAKFGSLITGCDADGSGIEVFKTHLGQTLRMRARVVEAAFSDRGSAGNRLLGDFSLHMVCADPRKYGENRSYAGGSVSAFHYGNFPASPVVEVVGPRTGPYTISGPGGRQFTVTQSLAAGQTHRINFRTGQVFRNGAVQSGAIGRSDLWTIPPGAQVAMSISSGSMTVTVSDTYM